MSSRDSQCSVYNGVEGRWQMVFYTSLPVYLFHMEILWGILEIYWNMEGNIGVSGTVRISILSLWMLFTGSLPFMLFIHYQIILYLDYLRRCIYHEYIIQKCNYDPPKAFLVALYTKNHIKHQNGTTINHPKCEKFFSEKHLLPFYIWK